MAYQDGDILVRAVMSNANGLVADEFVNDFAFTKSLAQTAPELLALVDRVDSFYNDDATNGFSVGEFISETVNRAATHRMDLYRIAAGGLGSPLLSVPWLGPVAPIPGSHNLPNEVACVVSFHADLTGVLEEVGTIRPKARRRGRLYIGPLIPEATDQANPNPGANTVLLQALREGIVRIASTNDDAGSGGAFGVWSRVDQVVRRAVGGWTDNAMDTQRRRGQESTARVTFGPLA